MNEKYYTFKAKIDSVETGHNYPAIETKEGYDFQALDSVHNIKSNELPAFQPNIKFRLASGSLLCDMLSQATISANGIIASKNLTEYLKSISTTVPYKIFSFELETTRGMVEYNWIQYVWLEGTNFVDFENTEFRINEFGNDLGPISISSYQEKLKKQTELGFTKMIYAKTIVMKSINFDLMVLPLNGGLIISDKIKKEIMDYSFTGIELMETKRVKAGNTM